MNEELITRLNAELEWKSAEEVLRYFLEHYKGRIALSSSLSIEDQVLTDIIVKEAPATPHLYPRHGPSLSRDLSAHRPHRHEVWH